METNQLFRMRNGYKIIINYAYFLILLGGLHAQTLF